MTKKVIKEISNLHHELSEIFDEMAETDDEEVIEQLMELATAIEYQIINLKAEFCL